VGIAFAIPIMPKRARLMDSPKEPALTADPREGRRALELILHERRRLLEGAIATRSATPDLLEAAQELEEEEVWLMILGQSHQLQLQVDEAMRLLVEGRYGQCIVCGQPIPLSRLRVLPFALRCLPCQEKHETRGNPLQPQAPQWGRIPWEEWGEESEGPDES